MTNFARIACLSFALVVTLVGRGESLQSLTTAAPTTQPRVLVVGFMGGRNKPDDPRYGVGRFAKKLREMNLPCVDVETVANTDRARALELVRDAFDRNHDGQIEASELNPPG